MKFIKTQNQMAVKGNNQRPSTGQKNGRQKNGISFSVSHFSVSHFSVSFFPVSLQGHGECESCARGAEQQSEIKFGIEADSASVSPR
jgi:hypothetical protein